MGKITYSSLEKKPRKYKEEQSINYDGSCWVFSEADYLREDRAWGRLWGLGDSCTTQGGKRPMPTTCDASSEGDCLPQTLPSEPDIFTFSLKFIPIFQGLKTMPNRALAMKLMNACFYLICQVTEELPT